MRKIRQYMISTVVFFLITSSIYAADIVRISVSSSGEQANEWSRSSASISANGRFVVFSSGASNLVNYDTNNHDDVFVHDRVTGNTEVVSISTLGEQSNRHSGYATISDDGRYVTFESYAPNLVEGDTNGNSDIFVHDRNTRVTELVSMSSTGDPGRKRSFYPSISADGNILTYQSNSRNLVSNDTNDVYDIFTHDRNTGITERVNVSSDGAQSNEGSYSPSLSANGRFVAFSSYASNLVDNDTNDVSDVFIHDRYTAITERVSVSSIGKQGDQDSFIPSISADGRFVVFTSNATNLVDSDTNRFRDVFVHDRNTGITERINISSNGEQGNHYSGSGSQSISADGRFVVFTSRADSLETGHSGGSYDVFIHDRNTGITKLVSVSQDEELGNDHSGTPSISKDGRIVSFSSKASNLVTGDTNNVYDLFATSNDLYNYSDELSVRLRTTSSVTMVGEYTRFIAQLTNNGNAMLTNCKVQLVNPLINYQREFSFYSWPLTVSNPKLNGTIDIAPGETGHFSLAVLPRVKMRKEVSFNYVCDSTQAYSIPFFNTVHLTAKIHPLISEDFIELTNAYPKAHLVIDRNIGKYWTAYTAIVKNTGSLPTSITLNTASDLLSVPIRLRVPHLCEPVNPDINDLSCRAPRAENLQVNLAADESKKIRVFVHAYRAIEQKPVRHRIFVEARDQYGEIVAKSSIGVSTLN